MPTESPVKKGKRTRTGLLTYTREFVVDTEDECLTVGPSSVNGCGEEDREWEKIVSGKERWKVTITYQGCEEDKETVTVKEVLREEPIESHPNIDTIKKTYQGTENEDGTISFPATISTSSSGGSGLSSSKKSSKNPMYGAKTYARRSAEWSRVYMRKTMPSDLLDKAGRTSKGPPGAPNAPAGKIWVYGCSEATQRGSAVEVKESATLEDESVASAVYGTLV